MAKILVLASSGFGKSTSIGATPELGIQGLDPATTYLITVTSKPLPFAGSAQKYPATRSKDINELKKHRRFISNSAKDVAEVMEILGKNPNIKTVVVDDFNYIMQDYYMANALKSGWDAPKKVGFDMGLLFHTMEKMETENIIIMAHYQLGKLSADETRVEYQMKTTGKMVDEFATPGGKFDITLVGKTRVNPQTKAVEKFFVTKDDGETAGAKSAYGMFPPEIPNDLGLVVDVANKFYHGTAETPVTETPEATA